MQDNLLGVLQEQHDFQDYSSKLIAIYYLYISIYSSSPIVNSVSSQI